MSKEAILFLDFAPIKNCKNKDTYGEICVQCNKCKRFKGNEIREEAERVKNIIGETLDTFLERIEKERTNE